jgi:ATP-dependent RNA helicase DHX29
MSATVDAQRLSSYLGGAPILTVPGRTFPVETKYLEDVVELTEFISESSLNSSFRAGIDDVDTDETSDDVKSSSAKDLRGAKYSARTRKTLSELDEYRINYDLILKLIEKIATDNGYIRYSKAILVFLPGMAEIRQLNDMLLAHPSFASGWNIYPLHSTITSEEQELAFLVPPKGIRKIVLATNVAETGLTIADSEHPQIRTGSAAGLIFL